MSESERISRLSAAILRISASLDVNTVLHEVVDSARALTGARYGLITAFDEAGQPEGLVASGFTDDEHRQLQDWPDGWRLFAHFRELRAPLRLADLPAYVRSLGFSADLMRSQTLQATPMRHRGADVGMFFLAGKEGGSEFTNEDEEVLVLFASQAAASVQHQQHTNVMSSGPSDYRPILGGRLLRPVGRRRSRGATGSGQTHRAAADVR